MAETTATESLLRSIGLFGGVDEESLRLLARDLPIIHAEVGKNVVTEGEVSAEMFVVIDGELEVLKRGPAGDVRVALLGPGGWFGEMSLIDVQPRSASVRALAPGRLLRISGEAIDRGLYRRDAKAYTLFVMNIARELSRRLRVTDGLLAQLVGGVSELYAPRKH